VATVADGAAFTLEEAAAWLDPPVTVRQLTAMVGALPGLKPVGRRSRGGPGRPALLYSADDLIELHAAIVRWL